MRFGSVAFFKVLIKTVLAIVFFVPLVLCIVFGVLWGINNAKLEEQTAKLEQLEYDNQKLTYITEMLSGNNIATVEGFYDLYAMSGLPVDELVAYINEKNGGQAQQPSGGNNEDTSSEPSDSTAPATSDGTVDELIPSEQEQTTASSTENTTSEPEDVPVIAPTSPYASLYTDMMVTAPDKYVREEGVVYLTFDDGPSENTYSVLHYMEKYDLKCTFFVVPRRTEECYEMMRAIVNGGHSIGVHSTTHEYTEIYASVDAFLADFNEAWNMIYEATGVKTEIYRFPGGSKNDFNGDTRDAIVEEMTRRGFRHYDWNVESNDVNGATWTEMYNSIPADIANTSRAIVLMHDSAPRENTVYVLEDVIKVLLNEGYKFDKIHNDTQPIQFIGPFA